jgi:fructose-specific component phosphotransferase system IIB-like protein
MRRFFWFACLFFSCACLIAGPAESTFDYRVLATSKTSTMQKEMNEAADAGFVFGAVMGGETAVGGKEVVVIMVKDPSKVQGDRRVYKLLATSKTSTMQKEIQQLGDEGFEYKGQTVFESAFGGKEVVVIMERDASTPAKQILYKLLATTKSSTMQKELREAGEAGFRIAGMTVAKTAFGGAELVSILRKD